MDEYVDNDGYPTEEALTKVENWPYDDVKGWFDFIESIWWAADWGWTVEGNVFHISTGGWSGNEDTIEAMQKNWILWNHTWWEHRRGGHYKFTIPEKKTTP